ncbi:DUF604 domain-containing protein [Senna tora]|uniref:DUF604 domain-containing protein n=1 Tax=Senna tora TaxID=362788 RepID=A0A835C8X8_9FABA|nr:DUF604 domain-containing protein [Senna tora]
MFCIAASLKTWKLRKPYIESWWEPNVTRGYVFFEEPPGEEFLPWPAKSPEFRVHEDVTKLDVFTRFNNPIQLRILRSVVETFKEADKDVKWFVMTDDDTVMVVENLLEVLAKYDYRKSYYIGMNSESVKSNVDFTFEMGFGGAGYALTYPLMEAIAEHLEGCLLRYTHLVSSDYIVSACVADLGIDPTFEKGFHQVDLHGDISGLLSAHPNAPFVSIHHMDTTEPIFPSKNRTESIHQLLRAAKLDRTRVLQQTICHHRPSHWSFSISWGYSLQIYESVFPRWLLKRPLETFLPWLPIAKPPFYMFNTRWPFDNPCEAPHAFFAESIKRIHNTEGEDEIVTTYVRKSPRNLQPCPLDGHQSAEPITKVQVFSPTTRNMEISDIGPA